MGLRGYTEGVQRSPLPPTEAQCGATAFVRFRFGLSAAIRGRIPLEHFEARMKKARTPASSLTLGPFVLGGHCMAQLWSSRCSAKSFQQVRRRLPAEHIWPLNIELV